MSLERVHLGMISVQNEPETSSYLERENPPGKVKVK
jgi:hypothetical protein